MSPDFRKPAAQTFLDSNCRGRSIYSPSGQRGEQSFSSGGTEKEFTDMIVQGLCMKDFVPVEQPSMARRAIRFEPMAACCGG